MSIVVQSTGPELDSLCAISPRVLTLTIFAARNGVTLTPLELALTPCGPLLFLIWRAGPAPVRCKPLSVWTQPAALRDFLDWQDLPAKYAIHVSAVERGTGHVSAHFSGFLPREFRDTLNAQLRHQLARPINAGGLQSAADDAALRYQTAEHLLAHSVARSILPGT